ncbi:pyridoxal-phosphate-dependent aminotransferase family protein [Granulosicoccus sp. 3-233]|uniref:pyridoxal-phosphate-dependent aminotransferase family protein n=1 Tax=Granulosicoccus sp. 3-233 TaxID=3417969 RepID=UPI003D32C122
MSLAFGRDHLAIPGPSVIPDRVLRAMHRNAPNIYAGPLVDLTKGLLDDLKRVAGCEGYAIFYIGNGHAGWEASLCNTLSRGDRILALVTGRFSLGWVQMARQLGIEVETLEFGVTEPADPARVQAALEADTDKRFKALITVQTDTSTSTSNDIQALRKALDAADHPALLMVDAIASFGCEPMRMHDWGVDVLLTASQKGLMTPPGLAIVFIGEKVWPLHEVATLNTPYWNWKARARPSVFPDHFGGTPPTHHLFGLREAVDMLLEESMEHVWERHRTLAGCVWATVDAWSAGGEIRCHVPNPLHRSTAVTAVDTADGDSNRLRDWCETQLGVVLGVGLKPTPTATVVDTGFRIGHMGHLNPAMLFGTLASIDAGLKALDIPHGSGALEAASSWIAQGLRPSER